MVAELIKRYNPTYTALEKRTKKTLTIFAVTAGLIGTITTVIGFFARRDKKEVVHNGKKKMLYPQDLLLERTLLKIIPDFIKPIHISFLRIVLTPLAALLIANGESLLVPLSVYLFVSFTDIIDGSMARTRDEITDFGKVLDPVADKLLFAFSALLLLPQYGAGWLIAVMIAMELGNIVMAGMFYQHGIDISANLFGKIKMNLQVLGIVCFLIVKYQHLDSFILYGEIAFYLAIFMHSLSICSFFIKRFFPGVLKK
jgi:CDP-diacylglycerol---glycerol-3-phosphate 3-phosphatidyltransferase